MAEKTQDDLCREDPEGMDIEKCMPEWKGTIPDSLGHDEPFDVLIFSIVATFGGLMMLTMVVTFCYWWIKQRKKIPRSGGDDNVKEEEDQQESPAGAPIRAAVEAPASGKEGSKDVLLIG